MLRYNGFEFFLEEHVHLFVYWSYIVWIFQIFCCSPDQKTKFGISFDEIFQPNRKNFVCSSFLQRTLWLVKKLVKIELLLKKWFKPIVARLVGSFFWWSLYKAKEWPEYNTRIACSIIREFFTLLFPTQTTETWWLDLNFSTAQIHIPIPNRKTCKMYENHRFLQKKWLRNGKSQTRDTQWQNCGR